MKLYYERFLDLDSQDNYVSGRLSESLRDLSGDFHQVLYLCISLER